MSKHAQYRYSLRKLSIGLSSVALGLTIATVSTNTAHADSVDQNENKTSQNSETAIVKQTSDSNSELENTNQQDSIKTIAEDKTNTETKTDAKTGENISQSSHDKNVEVNIQDKSVVQDSTQKKLNTSTKENDNVQSSTEKKTIDPALVNSATEHLSAVKYNVFDIREATEIWANDQLTNWYLKDSFEQIHDQLPTLTQQLLEYADNLDTAEKRVSDNSAAIMIGMSYINRWYNISYGDKELKTIMMFNPRSLGSNLDSIDWLTNIGKLTYEELLPENNVTTFNRKLAPMLNTKSNLITFLEDLRRKWSPNLTDDEWFKANTGIHIVEVPSKEVPDLDLHLYHRLSTGSASFQKFILPILNIKNDDMYVVSTLGTTIFGLYDPYIDIKYHKEPVVYQEKVKQVHKNLERLATAWGNHFDFWYRMTNQTGKERLIKANVQVWDSYDALDSSKKGGRNWLSKYGTMTPGMKEFFGPIGERYDPAGVSADAIGNMVRYYVARVVDDFGGIGIFTHEMTHNFDNSIYLDGYHHRPGTGVELYAEGLLQSPWKRDLDPYAINTALTFYSENRTVNKSPDRFKTREDLQEYMHGVFDVTYLLDYLEAQAMVNKSASEKQLMYSQISYDPAKKADVVSGPISTEVANKLNSIDDFIDNNIIASRGYRAGNYGNNAYQQISMYSPDYAGIQSSTSASGAITFRKTAFELLAAKGWEDGFITYITDKYTNEAKKAGKPLSDTYKLEKIFNGEYNNDYATFKKAMFKERIDKRNSFKPITITLNKKKIQLNTWEDLQKLMQTSVNQELAARAQGKGSNAINSLKAAVLMAEINQTNDFRNSIFMAKPTNRGEVIGQGTSYDLPEYDVESLKKGESIGEGTSYDLPEYDVESLKKSESVGEGTSYDLPEYDADSLKKGEAVEDSTSYDLPEYDVESLKKGESVGEGTSYDLPEYDVESLKKSESVGEGTSYDLPEYDVESLKKGESVGEGTSYDLPEYDVDSLKKSEAVEDSTSYDLPEYDVESLKKGESVGEGTSYDLPEYDADSLKKGEAVGEGTSHDLPEYDLESLKKSETVEDGTSYNLPEYDVGSLKKSKTVEDSTNYDLPEYDMDSLKKGEVVEDGMSYDLPEYDVDSLKKSETVEDATSYDLPEYNIEFVKKGDSVKENVEHDLPTDDLDLSKKDEPVIKDHNETSAIDKNSNVAPNGISISQDKKENTIPERTNDTLVDNKNILQKVEIADSELPRAEYQAQYVDNSKILHSSINSDADSVIHGLSLEKHQFNETKQITNSTLNYKEKSDNLPRHDQVIVSKSKNNLQLPQTSDKKDTITLVLGTFSSLFGVLWLSNLRRKDK